MKDFSFSKKIIFFSAAILFPAAIMSTTNAEVSTTIFSVPSAGSQCGDRMKTYSFTKYVCEGNSVVESLYCGIDASKCKIFDEQAGQVFNECNKIILPPYDGETCTNGSGCFIKQYACSNKCDDIHPRGPGLYSCYNACKAVEKKCNQECDIAWDKYGNCLKTIWPFREQKAACLKQMYWQAVAEKDKTPYVCPKGYVCANEPINGGDCKKIPVGASPTSATPPAEPGPQTPSIVGFTPTEVMAGKAYKNQNFAKHGFVVYETAYIPFKIYGKNLQGANLVGDNVGLDGQSGINFAVTEVVNNGAEVRGYIFSHPSAAEGVVNITLTNKDGLTAQTSIKVQISGTQYLKQKFKDAVILKGDWSDPMPSQRVLDLESAINDGLNQFKQNGYPKLEILPAIYEKTFWNDSVCGPDEPGSFVGGCAGEASRIIDIREIANLSAIKSTMLHEAAHKLDFYHRGEYRGVPGAPINADAFFKNWYAAAGVVNARTCQLYLPLRNSVTWKDGTSRSAHCGMIVAYGASDPVDDSVTLGNSWETRPGMYEDVATMVENFVFRPGAFSVPDASTDPRYPKKIQLLKNYAFVP